MVAANSVNVTLGDKEVEVSSEVSSEVIIEVLGSSDWLIVEVKVLASDKDIISLMAIGAVEDSNNGV